MGKVGDYSYTSPGTYQGLLGGDYTALQNALMQPGQIAADRAYQRGGVNLSNQFGGNGLYGSSMHARQAQDLTRNYADTSATNAAQATAQRYNLQNQDLQNQNNFGLKTTALENANEQAYNQLIYQRDRDAKDMYLRSLQMQFNNQNAGNQNSGGTNWGGVASGVGSLAGGLLSSIF